MEKSAFNFPQYGKSNIPSRAVQTELKFKFRTECSISAFEIRTPRDTPGRIDAVAYAIKNTGAS